MNNMHNIQKRNLEACDDAYEYWKQNKTHTEENRKKCLAIAKQLMDLIKINAPVSEFVKLEELCELEKIDDIGHGGFGLHSAIIAVLSDMGS